MEYSKNYSPFFKIAAFQPDVFSSAALFLEGSALIFFLY